MEFQSNIPIYIQLMDTIKMQIVSGKLKPGDRLSSVRDLAMEYGVNPNTVQKALGELEWAKLVFTVRTTGRFVTEDETLIHELRKELAEMRIREFFDDLKKLGYSKAEIQELLDRYMEGMVEDDGINTI